MVRKKDRFREYMNAMDNGHFKCKFCDRDTAGGIPRIKSHLSGTRGRDIEICTKVTEDVQATSFLAICGPNKKLKYETVLPPLRLAIAMQFLCQKVCIKVPQEKLSQRCSSSSCERNWSAFEAAQTKKRNRLAPNMLDDLVYVKMNTKMMEKFNNIETHDSKSINL
ncbi:hypothetical protein CFOL_v3_14288 [Cephalotus follicularis]|uniref:HAT C-terminal dimerisation domain-containing protein n=1 Tax=Cephalotus follicularis TaxID=3775 RepID=A0A1Q3BS35_CEPFO|nr:hypothetical protein CFOL_v3_14288 [Cephalotus follicularis]